MQVKLGSWIAGNPKASPGTIEWAGGLADMSKGPFVAAYRSIKVTDFMGGAKAATEYVYTDRSGSWESIKVVNNGKTEIGGGGSSSGNSTSTKPTGSKTQTTLVPTTSATAAATDSAPSSDATGDAAGSGSGSSTTTGAGALPTGAAGKVSLNLFAMGAAALGYLVL